MKKIAIFALCLVLSLGLLTACGSRDSSDETADPSSSMTTAPTTVPTTAATQPSSTATTPSSSGMLEDGMIDGNGDAGKSGRVNRMD